MFNFFNRPKPKTWDIAIYLDELKQLAEIFSIMKPGETIEIRDKNGNKVTILAKDERRK
jgi:hypothetical protein